MREKIKTAVIGMGKMGNIRYDEIKRHDGYCVAAVCDTNMERLRGFEEPFFKNWRECLEKLRPDAVFVCTTNRDIADIVCFALNLGIHVFSEKPPGRSLEDALRMRRAAENDKGVLLKFGFNHRFHNSVIEAKILVDSGLLGKAVCARGVYGKAGSPEFPREWRNDPQISGGGILLDQGIHMLDLLCYFLGDLEYLSGHVDRLVWDDIPQEDSAFAILRGKGGKTASLHSSAIQWKHKFDLDIICTEGYIALNGLMTATESYGEEKITYYRRDMRQTSGKIGNPIEHSMCFYDDRSWALEIDEFYRAITQGERIENGTCADAVRVMRLVESIYGKLPVGGEVLNV